MVPEKQLMGPGILFFWGQFFNPVLLESRGKRAQMPAWFWGRGPGASGVCLGGFGPVWGVKQPPGLVLAIAQNYSPLPVLPARLLNQRAESHRMSGRTHGRGRKVERTAEYSPRVTGETTGGACLETRRA